MLLISHHRNRKLAERKRRELQALHPRSIIRLVGRFNANEEKSKRGQIFEWSIYPKRKRKARREFVVHFDYGETPAKNLIRFQVHIFGPATASDAQAIRAIKEIEKTGEGPKGWTWKEIFWGHPESEEDTNDVENTDEDDTKDTLRSVRKFAIRSGRTKVRRKIPIRKDRNTK